jgi:HD-GYP domain-containing protein (c-di-GMP phosphodiesterase class II)
MNCERHDWKRAIREIHGSDARRIDGATLRLVCVLLARELDLVDYEVLDHGARVAHIAVQLGRATRRLDDAQLHGLHLAGLYHDLGKLKLPKATVHKPGPLDFDEWKVIRLHPEIGQAMVGQIPALVDAHSVAEAVRHHHEAWDGRGYPAGLVGHGIPLRARILAVADTWDALRTRRAYKEPHASEYAIEVMQNEAGHRLDPDLVDLLLSAI